LQSGILFLNLAEHLIECIGKLPEFVINLFANANRIVFPVGDVPRRVSELADGPRDETMQASGKHH
jgi:hypothetical protein